MAATSFVAVPGCSGDNLGPGGGVSGAAGSAGASGFSGEAGHAAGSAGAPGMAGGSGGSGDGGASGGASGMPSQGAAGLANGGSAGMATAGSAGMAGMATGGSAGMATGGVAGSASGGIAGAAGSGGVPSAGMSGKGGAAGSPGTAGAAGASTVGVHDPNNPPRALSLSGSLGAHDPSIIQEGNNYYIFTTGSNVPVRRSTDLMNWQNAGTAFSTQPAWMAQSGIPFDARNSMWAPDVSFFGGMFHLYYSVSSFGENNSCIGHATRASLESGSWTDHGTVICSEGQNYNAIDANVVLDEAGVPWMSFGSFWTGLKLIRLDTSGARADSELHSIAGGRSGPNAIEAPFIVRRGGYFYLFASIDNCCQGANSTYKLIAGRATQVQGPYTDKAGASLMDGGGTILLQGGGAYAAAGHNSVLIRGNDAFNVYHAYQSSNGAAVLRIAQLVWDADGWPLSGGP